jgi:hypothetical protein
MAVEDKGQRLEKFSTQSLSTPKFFPGMLLGAIPGTTVEPICQEGSNFALVTPNLGPFGSSGFKTGACQIDPSKSGDFETGRIDHSGFEIGEVVRVPPGFKTGVTPSFGSVIWLAEFQYLPRFGLWMPRPEHCELITTHNL